MKRNAAPLSLPNPSPLVLALALAGGCASQRPAAAPTAPGHAHHHAAQDAPEAATETAGHAHRHAEQHAAEAATETAGHAHHHGARHAAEAAGDAAPHAAGPKGGGPPPDTGHHPSPQQMAGHRKHRHGGMTHRFADAERWAKRFEDPRRDRWQKPEAVIAALALEPAMRVVDIGSATGYFTVRLARAVPQGKVWGIDIEPEMVRYLNERARREGLDNLQSRLGRPDDPGLPEKVDLIFICNTYHHIGDRPAYFRRLRDKLRPGGRLVIVDFKLGKIPVGPPERHRISPAKLDRELRAAGYARARLERRTLPYQYIAIYRAANG